jgi:hypothetical protein
MTYQKQSKTILNRSMMNSTLKRNFAIFSVPDWIAAITVHILNNGGHLACLCVFARRQVNYYA